MSEPVLRGLPPVVGTTPRILVLGSFPGVLSLERGEYYANPRNQFWAIMGQLAGAGPELAYRERLRCLTGSGIALWDVLAACRRRGSLDQRIERGSERLNDLPALVAGLPSLACCCLNGGTAGRLFRRLFDGDAIGLPSVMLPSTSPAHARLSPSAKLEVWREALGPYLAPDSRRA